MRLDKPRVAPLEVEDWSDEARELLQPYVERAGQANVLKTLTNHPDLLRHWLVFSTYILDGSTLNPRDRELAILRIGYLCRAGYEWGQHVQLARQAGMSDDDIRACKTGPETPGLSNLDRLILKATDELHADAHVTDETWAGLSEHYSTQQMMDLVFTVGQYNLVSMALNSLGVQLDEGLPGWDV